MSAGSALFPGFEPYQVGIVDPPWAYDNYGQRGHGAARSVYPCLTDEDLAAMPVGSIFAENAALVLWCGRPVLAEGRHVPVLRAWGFRPVTTAFVWVKTYRTGKPYCGLGHYTRSGQETAVLAIRGSMPRDEAASSVYEVFKSPVEAQPVGEVEGHEEVHSSKPPIVHELVRALWPEAKRIELFARRRVAGYDAWGAEAPQCDLVFGPEVGAIWTPRKKDEASCPCPNRELFHG